MKKSIHNINTGALIGAIISKHKISKSAVGKAINREGITVLSYLRNSSIQTGILLDLSHALKHNFFKDIASKLPEDFTHNAPQSIDPCIEKDRLIAQLQDEVKVLSIQNDIMKKALRIKD